MYVLILVLFHLAINAHQVTSGLKISVFYESLCPDCRNFIAEQLYPTFLKLEADINLDLVPFGKAKAIRRNGTWSFECQHGQRECYANKFHACAVNIFPIQQTVHFVTCDVVSGDPASDLDLRQCAGAAQAPWPALAACASPSGRGAAFLAAMGERTRAVAPPLASVPTVLFDGRFDARLQRRALADLFGLACALLGERPRACAALAAAGPSVVVVY